MPLSQAVKILLVDDLEQNILALEALLARPGLSLLRASSATEALDLLLTHDVALALIDVQMPGMDGFELAELMRGSPRTRDVPIIFLTASDRNIQRTFRGYEAGAVDFLYKPLDPHTLQSKVEVFVKLYAQKAQLTRQLETMEQSLRLNEMFAAVLGHDLRSPLSAVMVGAELIIVRNKNEDDVAAAKRIRDSAKRMSHLISQLIDMARVRSGNVNLSLQATDFAAVCKDMIAEVEATHPQRVSLELRGDTQGTWDPHRLSQIVSNLLGNAVKHGAPDVPVKVLVDGTQADHIRCSVHNGGTIPAPLLPHMFKPFRGSDSGGDRRAGLGLGLFIVHQLVNMHGGEISVRSNESEGTEFTVVLQRHTRKPSATPLTPSQAR